ncbi:Uncharacterised protein [Bordetella pertussis]|nr:Uncharacterised protein [Bordetella pertussis]
MPASPRASSVMAAASMPHRAAAHAAFLARPSARPSR